MTTINTNIGALSAQANMTKVNNDFNTAMTRLSSGLRINAAKDDAAGMAIAEKMTSQVMGINQAVRNATDGKNLIDTTESAHVEVSSMLQRVRELAVQSASDTNTGSDRGNITAEARQLLAEINRVAENTTFNGMKVMDGSFSGKQFQIGADAGQTLSISIDSTAATDIGAHKQSTLASASATGVAAQDIVITGSAGSAEISATAGQSAESLAAAVNAASSQTGVAATAKTQATLSFTGAAAAAGTVSFTINGTSIGTGVAISTDAAGDLDLTSLRDAINSKSASTGVTATMGDDNTSIVMTDANGSNITLDDYTHTATTPGITLSVDADGDPATAAVTSALAVGAASTVTGQVSFTSTESFAVSATAAATGFFGNAAAASFTSDLDAVADIDLSTAESSAKAIEVIDVALQKISQSRGDLGAVSNRLDSTISNLTNISVSTQAAKSQIVDADFAQESTNLARGQILSQAATAMLAQANSSKQNVMSLLRG
jgi:flagellin